MNLLRIVVEGERDCYFLHNLIVRRMAQVLKPVYANGHGLVYDSSDDFVYAVLANESVKVQVVKSQGYQQLKTIKTHLLDNSEMDSLCRVAVVFDADTTGVDNGGVRARTQKLIQTVAELTQGAPTAKYGVGYFLVPDNIHDGDVETLMTLMAIRKFPDYFEPCWSDFQDHLKEHHFAELSDKSKIYDYIEAASDNCHSVVSIKEKQGYNKNLAQTELWDWNATALDPLIEFLTSEINLVVSNLSTNLNS